MQTIKLVDTTTVTTILKITLSFLMQFSCNCTLQQVEQVAKPFSISSKLFTQTTRETSNKFTCLSAKKKIVPLQIFILIVPLQIFISISRTGYDANVVKKQFRVNRYPTVYIFCYFACSILQ